jgi:ketosteroid isomerase-like protein
MSQENIELVKDAFSRWNAGERTFADQIHPEVEILSRGLMEGRLLRGREGVRRWFREVDEQFDEWTLTMEEWRDVGDYVVALGRAHMHGRRAGSNSTNQLAGCLRSETVRFSAWRPSSTTPTKPSKPPGCGSRRCRRSSRGRPEGSGRRRPTRPRRSV